MRILAVSGSLSPASTNRGLLAFVAASVAPPDELVVIDVLDDLPHFSPERDTGTDGAVTRWREAVAAADAIVICTPEYAGGMPGALKNGLDWLVGSGDLYGKRAVVVSAAPAADRGGRARESAELTLTMQGAQVCDSFTVAVRRDGAPDDLAAQARVVADRIVGALTACASEGDAA